MTDWKEVQVLRGHELLSSLCGVIKPLGGYVAGGFARWCVTPNTKLFTEDFLEDRSSRYDGDIHVEATSLPSVPFGDIDIFSSSDPSYYALYKRFRRIAKPHRESKYSVTWHNEDLETGLGIDIPSVIPDMIESYAEIQLIKPLRRSFENTAGTLEEILETFDFSICRAGITNPQRAIVDPNFMSDEKNMRLRIMVEESPKQLLMRLAKYCSIGYKIDSFTAFQNLAQLKILEPPIRSAVSQICAMAENNQDWFNDALQELYKTFIDNNQYTKEPEDFDWLDACDDWLEF